ncbi:MAG: glycoside hydrolase [bacterium]|nr:glycoside hydrolase [bacterium]
MARLKIAYIGGGSTRAPGTVASFIQQGDNFQGSEIVLIDFDPDKMSVIKAMADRMIRVRGLDMRISFTTDRQAGLTDCDTVLTSYRPGGFEARHQDETIPLKYGIVGQETQGPGGFFMALRSIHVMQGILADMERVCPSARLFNYTNPINLVSEAVTHHSPIPILSFCEGPIYYPRQVAQAAGLDPDKLDTVMVGLNHGCWSIRHTYDGADAIPLLREAYAARLEAGLLTPFERRLLKLTVGMESVPSDYLLYYTFRDEMLAEARAKPTSRSQDIMARVPAYWAHYRKQAAAENPTLDPAQSRGGIHELELAIDAMDAIYNDRKVILPVNIPNHGVLPSLPADRVVEIRGYLDQHGVVGLADGDVPPHTRSLILALSEYQSLAAEAAWSGRRIDAIRALAANPLVLSFETAEALYDAMAAAQRDHLPERLLS